MIKNYVPAERKKEISYDLIFYYNEERGGFGFPCDQAGNLLPFRFDAARENYEYCMAHPEEFETFAEVRKFVSRYTEPAHGTCTCGSEVTLYDQYCGACQCEKCGRWYNLFGQELLPPEQWESDPYEYDD